MERLYTFQFCRISITGRLIENKVNFYSDVFSKKSIIKDQIHKYTMADVEYIKYDFEEFFIGKFVKYKFISDEEIFNEEKTEIDKTPVKDHLVAKPDFIIHPKSGILAFRQIKQKFNSNQFKQKFSEIIEAAYDNFFISVNIETINEDLVIQEQIEKLRKILTISVKIHPSNPNSGKYWKSVDDRMQKMNIQKYDQYVEAKPEGLTKKEFLVDDIYKSILMAKDGYGHAVIEGEAEDGSRIKVATHENPLEARAPISVSIEKFVEIFYSKFKKVWLRTKDDEK